MKIIDSRILSLAILICSTTLLSVQLYAQASEQPSANYKLQSFGLKVSDVEASLKFYQSLFDAPILHQEGTTVYLGLGSEGEFMSLSAMSEGESPSITYIGIEVKDFDSNSLEKRLAANGLRQLDNAAQDRSGLKSAMNYWQDSVSNSNAVKAAITLSDYEGVQFRLLPEDYCLNQNTSSESCKLGNAINADAPMSLLGINHFTTFVANFERANTFYRKLLGIENHMFQGSFPTLGVGDGYQFLMFVGGAQQGAPTAAANIHHVSLAVKEFDVEKIQSILSDKGLNFAGSGNGVVPPLSHYVSLRMPERGGAEGGTPELYFTDPDGLRIQLQDVSYCGGGGYLGNECQD